ncbi:hypothetical protein PTSG_02102 [Salpingoeca rosetta]|uniref:Protein FAM98A n=1 Tax=Salpingoeca rosetta (strain ATCC 50818 / BSB-021) TaxID=946362 RepID=F2U2M8_SALR5|nr:uncharacterized protein PTSG_02102 [Salpingoeca rosetta]EGD81383.1 hypothetical protein PTSG_02102 [Salpingoeca rosetta]|eukprot:XP_004996587.1 hypothetical protein PTSG_02102 [Salpingoeca rosetta]
MSVPEARSDAILDALEDLAYSPLPGPDDLDEALLEGVDSPLFVAICVFLSNAITKARRLETVVSSGDDTSALLIELSSFLQEAGCPFDEFEKDTFAAVRDLTSRINLLEWLCSEAQTARMIRSQTSDKMDVATDFGTSAEDRLASVLSTLGLSDRAQSTTSEIFSAITARIQHLMKQAGQNYIEPPILSHKLSPEQWAKLEDINAQLSEEYAVRRQMLLKRIDVTIQSFKWSDRVKKSLDELERSTQPLRHTMTTASDVDVHDVLFASRDLLNISKTSGAAVRHATAKSKIRGIFIGDVPDRGGRPTEQRAPGMMPAFRKRTVTARPQRNKRGNGGGVGGGGRNSGGGGGRRRGKKGGRVQGGWSKS